MTGVLDQKSIINVSSLSFKNIHNNNVFDIVVSL